MGTPEWLEPEGGSIHYFTIEPWRKRGGYAVIWRDSGIVRETPAPPIRHPCREQWDRQACFAARVARVYGRLEPYGA